MQYDRFLLDEAQRHLDRAWRRALQDAGDEHTKRECPAAEVLPQLLDIIAESPHEPVANRTGTIRRLIHDRSFPDVAGFVRTDLQVQVMVRVLETVRNEAIRRGTWSDQPAAPLMFG